MPKRNDIKKILIIGSGPIVIGQACEFDYSGTQACKALGEEGYEIILVNSNPATIMTDPGMADKTYIEPLTFDSIVKIIEKERPDALLPNLGGQTALNMSAELDEKGILKKYDIELIGIKADVIKRGEDRIAFKETMASIDVEVARSSPSTSIKEAEKIAEELGYPVVLRPAYTMGGTGGGIVYNIEELREIMTRGLSASLIGQVLVEECVIGWEELELEVVRDLKGNKITVCFIENVDPMGIHTGDSFCVAPMLTVPQELQDRLQKISYKIIDAIGVTGGTNVQFAHDRKTDRIVVIEINPRTSRSSALASKATGFPIARISTKLAAGYTLDEIPYWRSGTLDKYTPSGDYVVVKFARWAFEKFPQSSDQLGTQMKAVGEVMSIGKNFKEAFQKAIRSLEISRYGLGGAENFRELSEQELRKRIATPTCDRLFQIYETMRKGVSVEEVFKITNITKWFLNEIKELVDFEEKISACVWNTLSDEDLAEAKLLSFSDRYLANMFDVKEQTVRERRQELNIKASYCKIKVSGVENGEYYYSTYKDVPDEVAVSQNSKKIMILGSGPNRIGQGIEFDYTCVHAAFSLRDMGYESVMVNCNPSTVSTDYDTSNKLYFEPLTLEDVLAIYEKEKPFGIVVQFGGQTPLNIAQQLKDAGVKILGTSPESIRLAEDREYFRERMIALNIPQPESGTARSLEEAVALGRKIGYPVMVRPSFVLGGRGMEVLYEEDMLKKYAIEAIKVSPEYPMLIDRFLENALEAEVDSVADGEQVFVASVMEHIELAGIHSGDSACVIPSITIAQEHLDTIEKYAAAIAKDLDVCGIMNIQFAICDDVVYIIEANPRASRTVPIVSKITGIALAKAATEIMMGKKISDVDLLNKHPNFFGVKEAVFPFNMFPEVDPLLGPEMRATGEVMGIASNYGLAFYKAQESAGATLPTSGTLLLSVSERERQNLLPIAQKASELGFKIVATQGTAKFLSENDINATVVKKLHEGRPNIGDMIKNKEINLIVNTPIGREGKHDDSYIRMTAIQNKVPYVTTLAAAKASLTGIEAVSKEIIVPKSLQEHQK